MDFSRIDTAVHGPVRLGVLTALQAEGELDFTTLKRRLGVADGAIGAHLLKLETIGYITCAKDFVGRRPRSTYALTGAGRGALFDYLDVMRRLIDSLHPDAKPDSNGTGG
ncbi:MAG: transcriptional regulator [Akkermansiaceae bacterium]|nr:transcriptional regulator [Akkermansiaceae bacterium]MCP5549492.1 transcriptional regulator [Akkermansiaceae bacterium]